MTYSDSTVVAVISVDGVGASGVDSGELEEVR